MVNIWTGLHTHPVTSPPVHVLLECILVCHVSGTLTDTHILNLSERITSERKLMNLGIKVLGYQKYVIEGALANKKEIQMVAHDVLSQWLKKQKNRQEAYRNLYTALRKNNMKEMAILLTIWVEATAGERGRTLEKGAHKYSQPVVITVVSGRKCFCRRSIHRVRSISGPMSFPGGGYP